MTLKANLPTQLLRTGATGAVLLGAAGLHGAVVYNDFADLALGPQIGNGNDYGSVRFDPVGSTIMTLGPNGYYLDSAIFHSYSFDGKQGANDAFRSGGSFNGGSHLMSTSLLAAGTTIGGGTSFTLGRAGLPGNLTNVYEGVEINTTGGSIYFGWVRFSTGANFGGNVANGANTITLLDAAFENTPNTPIAAGATVATVAPEPSTLALLGLAGGAVAFSRRRRAASAN